MFAALLTVGAFAQDPDDPVEPPPDDPAGALEPANDEPIDNPEELAGEPVEVDPAEQPAEVVPAITPIERTDPNRSILDATARIREARPLVEMQIEQNGHALGTIVIELHREKVNLTTRNFLLYVNEGFYNGTIFHRVIPGFIAQGGGYTSPTELKTEGLHSAIRNESPRSVRNADGVQNARGTVAMARKQSPHSALTQFYINLGDNSMFDFPNAGAYGYTVFGEVIKGMDVIERIARTPTSVSPAAQARYDRYKQEGKTVEQVEKSLPTDPPVIASAREMTWDQYKERYGELPFAAANTPEATPRKGFRAPIPPPPPGSNLGPDPDE